MRVFDEKERCSGCTACMNSCPVGAISMIPDEEGFLYPEIDEGKCIHCGLCRKICPFHGGYDRSDNFETPLVYAVKHADEKVREASTSGGMFTALSDFLKCTTSVRKLSLKGTVCEVPSMCKVKSEWFFRR